MTLQNLGKILDKYESELGFTTLPNQYELLKGLPFYCQWKQSSTVIRVKHAQCSLQPYHRSTSEEWSANALIRLRANALRYIAATQTCLDQEGNWPRRH